MVQQKQKTKDRIILAGAKIVHEKGYNHTGLKEILAASGVPKGSFYFHFKSKDDFGIHLIDYYSRSMLEVLDQAFADKSIPPVLRIRHFFQEIYIRLEAENFTGG